MTNRAATIFCVDVLKSLILLATPETLVSNARYAFSHRLPDTLLATVKNKFAISFSPDMDFYVKTDND